MIISKIETNKGEFVTFKDILFDMKYEDYDNVDIVRVLDIFNDEIKAFKGNYTYAQIEYVVNY